MAPRTARRTSSPCKPSARSTAAGASLASRRCSPHRARLSRRDARTSSRERRGQRAPAAVEAPGLHSPRPLRRAARGRGGRPYVAEPAPQATCHRPALLYYCAPPPSRRRPSPQTPRRWVVGSAGPSSRDFSVHHTRESMPHVPQAGPGERGVIPRGCENSLLLCDCLVSRFWVMEDPQAHVELTQKKTL